MRKVEAYTEIPRSPEQVFDAFTELPLLKGWWGVERCLIEKRQGGLYSLAWDVSDKGFRYISTGIITVYKPGVELLIDHFVYFNPEKQVLGPTWLKLVFEKKENEHTLLRLTQGGYREGGDWDWFYDSVLRAWPQALGMLKNFLTA